MLFNVFSKGESFRIKAFGLVFPFKKRADSFPAGTRAGRRGSGQEGGALIRSPSIPHWFTMIRLVKIDSQLYILYLIARLPDGVDNENWIYLTL